MTKNEAIIEKAVAGAMGKEVIIREIRGKIVVTDKPVFKDRVLSQKQERVTEFMTTANDYVKYLMQQEILRNEAQIRLNVTKERLYTALISEYWKSNWGKDDKELEKIENELVKRIKDLEKKPNDTISTQP